jgi:hypothetical protein
VTVELTKLIKLMFLRNLDEEFRYSEIEREVKFFLKIFDPESNYNNRKLQDALKLLRKNDDAKNPPILEHKQVLKKSFYKLTSYGKQELTRDWTAHELSLKHSNYVGAYLPNCSYEAFQKKVIQHFIDKNEDEMRKVHGQYKTLYDDYLRFKKQLEEDQ